MDATDNITHLALTFSNSDSKRKLRGTTAIAYVELKSAEASRRRTGADDLGRRAGAENDGWGKRLRTGEREKRQLSAQTRCAQAATRQK